MAYAKSFGHASDCGLARPVAEKPSTVSCQRSVRQYRETSIILDSSRLMSAMYLRLIHNGYIPLAASGSLAIQALHCFHHARFQSSPCTMDTFRPRMGTTIESKDPPANFDGSG
jgi:hypothetical protein